MPFTVDLDARCGRHFTYRDLIECGKTWSDLAADGRVVDNLPRSEDSLRALHELCRSVLDPIADAFGRPKLTYGFASPNLTRMIPNRIAPRLDQHASHEEGGNGKLICDRKGAAADVIIPGHAATSLARWIFDNTEFDRLYVYGDDRPIHVSVGPQRSRAVIGVVDTPRGRRPQILRWAARA